MSLFLIGEVGLSSGRGGLGGVEGAQAVGELRPFFLPFHASSRRKVPCRALNLSYAFHFFHVFRQIEKTKNEK